MKYHTCEAKPEKVYIGKPCNSAGWWKIIYALSKPQSGALSMVLENIKYCPYCGENLEGDDE